MVVVASFSTGLGHWRFGVGRAQIARFLVLARLRSRQSHAQTSHLNPFPRTRACVSSPIGMAWVGGENSSKENALTHRIVRSSHSPPVARSRQHFLPHLSASELCDVTDARTVSDGRPAFSSAYTKFVRPRGHDPQLTIVRGRASIVHACRCRFRLARALRGGKPTTTTTTFAATVPTGVGVRVCMYVTGHQQSPTDFRKFLFLSTTQRHKCVIFCFFRVKCFCRWRSYFSALIFRLLLVCVCVVFVCGSVRKISLVAW